MTSNAATTRDAGLALIGRINRWMIAGAVALSGMISVVAARSFHGHTASSSSAVSQPRSNGGSSSSAGGSSSSNGGLSQPSQPPSSSSAPAAPAPVISGGS